MYAHQIIFVSQVCIIIRNVLHTRELEPADDENFQSDKSPLLDILHNEGVLYCAVVMNVM